MDIVMMLGGQKDSTQWKDLTTLGPILESETLWVARF